MVAANKREPVCERDSAKVLKDEEKFINTAPDADGIKTGLAYSGGGIRSASFGLGIMQALAEKSWLGKFDYLSSVSGGGYLSSSLTWFLSRKDGSGKPIYDTAEKFPFGEKGIGSKHAKKARRRNAILDYLRQHGNYLIPGHGLNTVALIATTLRVLLTSFSVFFLLTTAVFVASNFLADTVVLSLVEIPHPQHPSLFLVAVFLALATAINFCVHCLKDLFRTSEGVSNYDESVALQVLMGKQLLACGAFILVALIALFWTELGELGWSEFLGVEGNVTLSGLAALVGSVMGLIQRDKSVTSKFASLKIVVASSLVLFGFLMLAYGTADWFLHLSFPHRLLPSVDLQLLVYLLVTLAALIIAYVSNINLFGLNRMYRNRLMEAFMPHERSIASGRWAMATEANKAKVADMCGAPEGRCRKPYHLINCNVILTDSKNAKYRGRKGDSFVISPKFCGSDATGWQGTDSYLTKNGRSGLTLPTAMATSGAAANSNAGVAGAGPTTGKMLSILMSLLSIRLGFWADNPARANSRSLPRPNFLWQLAKGVLACDGGLSENSRIIELSDGGHFENLAVYELVRRRLDIIIVSDAGQDGKFKFADLGNLTEKAKVDFGTAIEFLPGRSFAALDPFLNEQGSVERGYAIAAISYPELKKSKHNSAEPEKTGWLIYFKPTLLQVLNPDIVAYHKAHSEFPHESTADQFFNEKQFEAYRELGYEIAKGMLSEVNAENDAATNASSAAEFDGECSELEPFLAAVKHGFA